MTNSDSGQRILDSNHALRMWAAGLRSWSSAARASSSCERLRAEELRLVAASGRDRRTGEVVSPLPMATPAVLDEPVLPSLDDVRVDELVAVLVGRHRYRAMGAVRAMRIALLIAGYPPETEEVLAADALDILDSALDYPG